MSPNMLSGRCNHIGMKIEARKIGRFVNSEVKHISLCSSSHEETLLKTEGRIVCPPSLRGPSRSVSLGRLRCFNKNDGSN